MGPYLIVALSVCAPVLASALTMAPRGVLYLLGVRNITGLIYLLFWAPFLCTAVYAIFTQRPKIRRLFVIAYVLVAIANIGGCAFEITHAFN